ncbi:flagellin, partial [Ensifer sp. 2YAB10]
DNQGNVSLTTLQFDTNKSSLIQVDSTGTNVTNGTGLLSSNMEYKDATGSTVTAGYSVLSMDITNMTAGALAEAISGVDATLLQMTDAASDLGALNSRVELQKNFVQDLSDSIEKGIGKLVDADMNEESTRLKALQTQQQLGIQALSIANSNSQNILSLFR